MSSPSPALAPSERSSAGLAPLILIALAQFMVVLDVTVVNIALPSIKTALGISQDGLQWVVTAYTLMFAGLLLLGGRLADLLGRRTVFIVGIAVFSLASLACGLAQNETMLIVARAVQGTGAAIVSPAALSILTSTYREGPDRTRAFGVYAAVAGAGGAIGVLLGGVLVEFTSWEWIFFVNVPVGLAVALLAPRLLAGGRAVREGASGFDLAGAITVTASLMLLVYAVTEARTAGWTDAVTLGRIAGAVALFGAFLVIEARSAAPLVRLSVFRNRSLTGANLTILLVGSALFASFFFMSLYLQQVLGLSALKSGLGFLPFSAALIVAAQIGSRLLGRVGPRALVVTGLIFATAGLFYLSRMSADGSYAVDILPGMLLMAPGLGLCFIALTTAATNGVEAKEAGLASGIFTTSQQIGGAIGLAVLSTLANTRAGDRLASVGGDPAAVPGALVDGFRLGLEVGGSVALLGVVIAAVLLPARPRRVSDETELVAEVATAAGPG